MSRKTPAGAPTNNLVLSAHTGSNNQVFPHVLTLHVPPGSTVADVTFGRGVFWKNVPQDLFDLRATDLDTGTDCRDLPYQDGQMDCVVFDPPYMHSPGGSAHSGHQNFEQYYGNNRSGSATKYYEAVLDLYLSAAQEAWRVLRERGVYIVKCQDQVCANRQRLTHVDIVNGLTTQGFRVTDLFVVVRQSRPGVSRMVRQLHARKNHSYFLVFTKPKGKKA